MDEFVLGHSPTLENHLIGNDDVPMDPRDLFVRMSQVVFPSMIWSGQNGASVSSILFQESKVLHTEV